MEISFLSRDSKISNSRSGQEMKDEKVKHRLTKYKAPFYSLMPNFYKHASRATQRETMSSSSLVQMKRFSSSVLMNQYSDGKKHTDSSLMKLMGVRFDEQKSYLAPRMAANKMKSSILNLRNVAHDHFVAKQSFNEANRYPLGLNTSVSSANSSSDMFDERKNQASLRKRTTLPPIVQKKLQELKESLVETNINNVKQDSYRSASLKYKASQLLPFNEDTVDIIRNKSVDLNSQKYSMATYESRAKRMSELSKLMPSALASKKVPLKLPELNLRNSSRMAKKKHKNSVNPYTIQNY